jgi:hypothetical protein
MTAGVSSTLTDKQCAIAMTLGGIAFAGPGEYGNLVHGGQVGEFQTMKMSVASRGALTSPTTPASIYVICTTGTCLLDFYLETGAGEYGASAAKLSGIVETFNTGFADGQINSVDGSVAIQGANRSQEPIGPAC